MLPEYNIPLVMLGQHVVEHHHLVRPIKVLSKYCAHDKQLPTKTTQYGLLHNAQHASYTSLFIRRFCQIDGKCNVHPEHK